jgi:hypothetical protein
MPGILTSRQSMLLPLSPEHPQHVRHARGNAAAACKDDHAQPYDPFSRC